MHGRRSKAVQNGPKWSKMASKSHHVVDRGVAPVLGGAFEKKEINHKEINHTRCTPKGAPTSTMYISWAASPSAGVASRCEQDRRGESGRNRVKITEGVLICFGRTVGLGACVARRDGDVARGQQPELGRAPHVHRADAVQQVPRRAPGGRLRGIHRRDKLEDGVDGKAGGAVVGCAGVDPDARLRCAQRRRA